MWLPPSLLLLLPSVLSYRILVYSPSISPSHLISNERIADTLVDAGHEVVMFIPEYMTAHTSFNGTKKAKIIRMNGISSRFEDDLSDSDEYILANERLSFLERLYFEYSCTAMCDALMARRSELKVLREYNFDVAFTEQIDLCGVGVLRYLGIQNILWISTTPIMDAVSYNLGIPAPVSYVPTIEENDNSDEMNFSQRAFNLYMYAGTIAVHTWGTDMVTNVFRKYVSPSFPSVRAIASNSSLCFVNSDEMFDLARPILHKTIYIGGLGVKQPKPLDEKFSSIMSKGERGVIIMSLGSIAHLSALSENVKKDLALMVRDKPEYHFVFKISKGDETTIKYFEGSRNFDLVEWLPQSDILAHPRLSLFIMHGGVNGLTEALLRGVPVVIVPIFADQFRNGRNCERRGVGKVVLKADLNRKNLGDAVDTILSDTRYKENALRFERLMKGKPFSPEERLVKWTEFAAEHGVLDILHVKGASMSSIVYFNLDVFFCIGMAMLASIYLSWKIICCICCSSKKAVKAKQQ